VPATEKIRLVNPVPIKAIGRFNHEAVAVDPSTGIVYITEDRGDGIFYR
jgi:secreted PhoX family phosphatase